MLSVIADDIFLKFIDPSMLILGICLLGDDRIY